MVEQNGNGMVGRAIDGALAKWSKLLVQVVGIPLLLLGMQRGCDQQDATQKSLNLMASDQLLLAQAFKTFAEATNKHLDGVDNAMVSRGGMRDAQHAAVMDNISALAGDVSALQRSDRQQTSDIQLIASRFQNFYRKTETFICQRAPSQCQPEP